MNIIQLQDMLKLVPDDKLKQELANPNGPAPQYLILSEVVRRDKMRDAAVSRPSTTVVQDLIGNQKPQMPQAMASGGFVSASEAMGNAGVPGYPIPQPKMQNPVSASTGIASMFVPNAASQPSPPQTVNNFQVTQPQPRFDTQPQPKFDDGQSNTFDSPSYYEQGSYADGGSIRLAAGDLVHRVVSAESSGNRYAKNPRSTATGAGQFIDSTWLSFLNENNPGLVNQIGERAALDLRNDPNLSKQAVDWYAKKNASDLSSAGFQPTDSNLYLAHFAGPGGAKAILSANPNANAASILGKKVADANPFLKDMTAADLIKWSAKKVGGTVDTAMQQGKQMSYLRDLFYGNPIGAGQGAAGFEARAEGIPNPSLATRTGGIMDMIGMKPGTPGADRRMDYLASGISDLGNQMMQPRQVAAPDIPPMAAGNIQGLDRLRTNPDEMAQAMADYSKYFGAMASGGAVRMQEGGTPPSSGSWWDFFTKPAPIPEGTPELSADGRDLTPDEISKLTPEQYKGYQIRKANREIQKNYLEQEIRKGQSGVRRDIQETVVPEFLGGGAPGVIADIKRAKQAEIELANLNNGSAAPSSGLFGDDFRATPSQLDAARRESEKARAAAKELSPLDKLLEYYKSRDEQMNQLYQQQIDEERKRMQESGGLGAFLRRMGIGMLTDNSSFTNSLRAGAASATTGMEESRQQALDRIRELGMKKQIAGIESGNEAAKLAYDAAVAGTLHPKDYFGSLDDIGKVLSTLEESIKENGGNPDENPTVRSLRRAMQTALSRSGVSDTMGFAGFPAGTVITKTR